MAMSCLVLSAAAVLLLRSSSGVSANLVSDSSSCDFASRPDYFERGTFVTCSMPMNRREPIEVTCPREIGGVAYRFYPEEPTRFAYVYNKSDDGNNVKNFAIKEMPLEKIFGQVSNQPIVTWKDRSRTSLLIQYPDDGYLVRRVPYSILYFCKDERININSHAFLYELRALVNLRSHVFSNGRVLQTRTLRGSDQVGYMGVFKLNLDPLTHVTNGCGNVPTGLFNNLEMSNRMRPLSNCTVDVTATPNVGFYCEGIVEPRSCFDDLVKIGGSTSRITDLPNRMRRDGNFYHVNYNGNFMRRFFNGKCYCRDPRTNDITASIVVKREKLPTCDLVELFAQVGDGFNYGDLCSAVLYPSDSYRIIFPRINASYDVTSKHYRRDGGRRDIISALGVEDAQTQILQRLNPLEPMAVVQRDIEELFPFGSLRVVCDREESSITIHYKSEPEAMTEPIQLTYLWKQKTNGFKERVEMGATVSVVLMPRARR